MQTMKMDEMKMSQQSSMTHDKNAGQDSTGSCCDEIAQSPIGCAFVVPQSAYINISGGSARVGYLTPLIQFTNIETLAPPPKG